MGPIEKAIEEFRRKQLGVYQVDAGRISRDARTAERATNDHTGRWLFELLQNSDDAMASEVYALVKDDAIYVADNGRGLNPKAVSAICGTDFSDKTTGTIGRKGVGFKSVYELSCNPQVLTRDGEGIEFSPRRAKAWLQENMLDDGDVPYQWIPFFVPWDEAQRGDPKLNELAACKTVVKLCGVSLEKRQKVERLLKEWPPHALFAFRHLRRINAPNFVITLTRCDGTWEMNDSRGNTPTQWRVSRHIEEAPETLLKLLAENERKAISADGVGFLIAAPFENGCILPTKVYLPVHVFYPTEQQGPVRLLLHAEFLVKSDRTALMPVDSSPFNAWVAERLAYHVCEFVNGSYRSDKPSGHLALLVPFGEKTSHPVAEALWQRIADKAKADLQLADLEGNPRLTVCEARLISVSVRLDLARTLLLATKIREQLLHPAFDEDMEARKALRELGCKELHDQEVMEAIAKNADSLAACPQWVWACWEWLAARVAKEPYGDEHKKRVEEAKHLPIVPVDGQLRKPVTLVDRIVTWRAESLAPNLPDWLPLTYIEDWFRDRIKAVGEQKSTVGTLCAELDIKEPGADVIQRAVSQAIEQYWKDKKANPEMFLHFILEQDWLETTNASSTLQRCPVRLSRGVQEEGWAEARQAYFGREWGNDLLAALYAGIKTVAWIANDGVGDRGEKTRRILEWLGVAECPRVVKASDTKDVWQLPKDCNDWRKYLFTVRDHWGRSVQRIGAIDKLEHLTVAGLNSEQAVSLVRLIVKHWHAYYSNERDTKAQGKQAREQYDRSWQVKAKWWWEVCEQLPLPRRDGSAQRLPLIELWLPDKRTEQAIGDLLPVIDLDAFRQDKDAVRDWLASAVGLRTRKEQLTVKEWKRLLSTSIPDKALSERLMSDEGLRDKVTDWYAACLETVADQENISPRAFESSPLLCRKASSWQYVAETPRYLDDDNDLAAAFSGDVWLFHAPAQLAADAVKYLGLLRLSKSVQIQVRPEEPKSLLSDGLMARLKESLPYIWAWRSSRSRDAGERESLAVRLKGLKVYVVPALKADLDLNGMHHQDERHSHVETDDTILLHKDHANETELAQALARALDIRSEADFYENLLRCNDAHQRKEKLLSKGIAGAEVESCLRKYSALDDEEQEHEERPEEPAKGRAGGATPIPPSATGNETQQPKSGPDKQPGAGPDKPQEPGILREPFRLKNSYAVDYVIGSSPKEEAGTNGGSEGGGTGQEGHSLTDKEKAELEQAGRRLAARELEKLGFLVTEMPPDNPGFDLLAKRNGEELRVEVKAHTGRATVVDVTQRQYKEYLSQQGYRWELWNVEHLAEKDADRVAITRYDDIPDNALDARTFRVDLKKCQPLPVPSVAPE